MLISKRLLRIRKLSSSILVLRSGKLCLSRSHLTLSLSDPRILGGLLSLSQQLRNLRLGCRSTSLHCRHCLVNGLGRHLSHCSGTLRLGLLC